MFNNNSTTVNRQSGNKPADDAFSVFKNSDTPGMEKVETLLRQMDHPVSDSEAASIDRFMKDGSGSMSSKLETVEWAADKGIEMTDKNLSAIQETLNSEMNEAEMIETLAGTKEVTGEKAKDVLEKIKADPSIPDALKTSIEKAVESGMPIEKAVVHAVKSMIRANVDVKGNTVFLEKSPGEQPCVCINIGDLLKAVDQAMLALSSGEGVSFEDLLKEALVDVLGTNALEDLAEIFLSEEGSIVEGSEDESDEISGDDPNVIDSLEDDMKAFEEDMLERLEASFEDVMGSFMENANDEMASAITDIRFKSYLVEKVTAQAIEAKETFSQMKKEIVQSLRDIETPKTQQEKVDVKEVLSKAIEKLDNVLMKSDVTLFTSMKMERDLLNMSSTLQEARKLLGKGDVNGALEITKNVQGKLDQMIFTPSEKNIQLKAFKDGMNVLDVKPNMMPSINWQDTSPRGVLELFRDMGLNHEPEVAEKLLSHDKGMIKEDNYKIKDNLKAVLLKMIENDEPDNKRAVAGAEKNT